MELKVGQRVLSFILEQQLGKGGFGEVWRARAGIAPTALKFVKVAGEDLQRGKKEYSRVKLMIERGGFNHDRLIKLHGAWLLDEQGEEIPDAVLDSVGQGRTMEFRERMAEPHWLLVQMDLGDESLAGMLKRLRRGLAEDDPGGIPVDKLLQYIHEAAEGIDFLNTPRTTFDGQERQAVYHCDIKPENLLLADGQVRICDYGVMRVAGRETQSPNALSIAHASPELVRNAPCAQSDQYSLAITYTQLRTGRLPFKSEVLSGSWVTVMRAVEQGELDFNGLEPAVREVIKRATTLNPKRRYSSALEMADALKLAEAGIRPEKGRGKLIAAVVLLVSLLVGVGVFANSSQGRALGDRIATWWNSIPVPVPDPVPDFEYAAAKADFSANPTDGEKFDRLDKLASDRQKKLDEEDLQALHRGVATNFDEWFKELSAAALDADKMSEVRAWRGRVEKHLAADEPEQYANRFKLLVAQQELRQQYADSAAPPERLSLFEGESEGLDQGAVASLGLSEKEQANLRALRALVLAHQGPDPLDWKKVLPAVGEALREEPSDFEKARLSALKPHFVDAVTSYIAEHGIDTEVAGESRNWAALKINPVDICLNAVVQLLDAKRQDAQAPDAERAQEANRLLGSIAKYPADDAGGDTTQTNKVAWYKALVMLQTGDAAEALKTLGALADQMPSVEIDRLSEWLARRFSKPLPDYDGTSTWAASELKLLTQAITLVERIEPTKQSANVAVARHRLLAQRMLVRLLLPAGADNGWKVWLIDAKSIRDPGAVATQLDEQLRLAGLTEAVGRCLREYEADQKPTGASPPGAAPTVTDTKGLPGYAAYVAAITTDAKEDASSAAQELVSLYTPSSGAPEKNRIPGLDWPERKSKASGILFAAAAALRGKDERDLSVAPFTEESAKVAAGYLKLSENLVGKAGAPNASALACLAAYYSAPNAASASLLADVERLLAEDKDRKDNNAIALLLVSARLNAAANKHDLAAPRFAEALQRFDAWATTQEDDDSRNKAVAAGPLAESVKSADAIYEAVGANAQSPLRTALAGIYSGAARRLAALAIATGRNSDRELIAKCFARAYSMLPHEATLRDEGKWLRYFHTGRFDRDWKQMKLVVGRLPENDPVRKRLQAYLLYVGYARQADPVKRRDDLKQAILLYGSLLPASPSPGNSDPVLWLERGDTYLQLAHVAVRAQAELGESNESVHGYLKQAVTDAEAARLLSSSDALRISALNLAGNATEDMSYYGVDKLPEGWRSHFVDASTYFNAAFDLDNKQPLAAFNLARCKLRLYLAERRRPGQQAKANKAALDEAMGAIDDALKLFPKDDSAKKAEAYFWKSKLQDELQQLDEADESCGIAVGMAERVGDPFWQLYQLEWADLAARRLRETTDVSEQQWLEARNRAKRILDQADLNVTLPAEDVLLRVDTRSRAQAAGLLVKMYPKVEDAIVVAESAAKHFAGDDLGNKACRAELNLALAQRIMALQVDKPTEFAEFKERAEKFASQAVTETDDEVNRKSQAITRAKAHWILGDLFRTKINPGIKSEKKLELRGETRRHYLAGAQDIVHSDDLPFQIYAMRSNIVYRLGVVTGELNPELKEGANPSAEERAEYKVRAEEALSLINEVRPRLDALPDSATVGIMPAAKLRDSLDKMKRSFENVVKSP